MSSYFETWPHLPLIKKISGLHSFPKSSSRIERAYQLYRGVEKAPELLPRWAVVLSPCQLLLMSLSLGPLLDEAGGGVVPAPLSPLYSRV